MVTQRDRVRRLVTHRDREGKIGHKSVNSQPYHYPSYSRCHMLLFTCHPFFQKDGGSHKNHHVIILFLILRGRRKGLRPNMYDVTFLQFFGFDSAPYLFYCVVLSYTYLHIIIFAHKYGIKKINSSVI